MRRSASESSLWAVPNCGIQVPPPLQAPVKAATGMVMGPVSVAVPAVKVTFVSCPRSTAVGSESTKKPREDASGGGGPSMSDGRTPPNAVLNWKQIWVAGLPASMLVRSKAQSLGPANVWPLLKTLYVIRYALFHTPSLG